MDFAVHCANPHRLKVIFIILSVGWLSFALGCSSISEHSEVLPRSLDENQLRGVWIGYDQDCLLFYRLSLDRNKKGSCTVLYLDELAGIYAVDDWETKAWEMTLVLSVASKDAERIKMTVLSVDQSEIQIRVSGEERDWEHRLVLHREDSLLRSIRESRNLRRAHRYSR